MSKVDWVKLKTLGTEFSDRKFVLVGTLKWLIFVFLSSILKRQGKLPKITENRNTLENNTLLWFAQNSLIQKNDLSLLFQYTSIYFHRFWRSHKYKFREVLPMLVNRWVKKKNSLNIIHWTVKIRIKFPIPGKGEMVISCQLLGFLKPLGNLI